eukprot:EG_transcript_7190
MDSILQSKLSTMDPAVLQRLQEVVQHTLADVQARNGMLFFCVYWVTLGLAGWNGWTLAAYVTALLTSLAGTLAGQPLFDEIAGFVIIYIVYTVVFVLLSITMEMVRRSNFLARTRLAQELQASQLADSVLNHLLKNALADVAADIEIFLAGELGPEVLEDAVVCLRRGMRSCRARMLYLRMVAGEYVSVLNAVDLREFGQELVAGRRVALEVLDGTVLMDGTLMQLILENMLSNAFKHGHPEHPDVQLIIRMEESRNNLLGMERPHRTVSFIVRNVAHPLRPRLTDEAVRALFHGRGQAPSPRGSVIPSLSDGVGLLHCALAARLGGIALALRQEGDVVTFTATVEAEVPEGPLGGTTELDLVRLGPFPPGLKVFCLDDSAAARRLLEFHLKRGCPSAVVRAYGAAEDEVGAFLSDALQQADIVILDQHLQFPDSSTTYTGTDLCRQLLGHGFRGLVCIRSGDDAPEDQ